MQITEEKTVKGIRFFDEQIGPILLVTDKNSSWYSWWCRLGPEGQWVSLRFANRKEIEGIIKQLAQLAGIEP